MRRKTIVKPSHKKVMSATYVKAEDDMEGEISEVIDDVADNVEDLQDTIDDMHEDDPDIEVNNNIVNHYIAECDHCQNVFISAVTESSEDIEFVKGICPICKEESEHRLKWIIREV